MTVWTEDMSKFLTFSEYLKVFIAFTYLSIKQNKY